jgi:hypothetical protein
MNTVKVYVLFLRHLIYGVMPSTYFFLPGLVLHVFRTGNKIRFHDFCLSLHGPAKIDAIRVLRTSGTDWMSYIFCQV